MPVPHSSPWLRFQSPLVEPDVQISRIRLSDEIMPFRPREARRTRRKVREAVIGPEPVSRVAHYLPGPHLVLAAEPLAQRRVACRSIAT